MAKLERPEQPYLLTSVNGRNDQLSTEDYDYALTNLDYAEPLTSN